MQTTTTEGVVLHRTLLPGDELLFDLYTPEGRLSLKASARNRRASTLAPLFRIEAVYRKGSLWEVDVLASYPRLRTSLDHLQTASFLAKAILRSQPPATPNHNLYQLLCGVLEHLPRCSSPFGLGTYFLLKILSSQTRMDAEFEKLLERKRYTDFYTDDLTFSPLWERARELIQNL